MTRPDASLRFQERIALLATAFLFPLGSATLIVPWLFVLRIVQLAREGCLRWVRSPLDFPLAGFLLLALIAGLRSPLPAVALTSWLLAVVAVGIVLQTTLDTLHEAPHFVQALHKAFALGTLCAATCGLLVLYIQRPDRAQLPTIGPNALGFGLMTGVLLLVPLLKDLFPWRVVAAFTAAVSTAGIIATFSRGALYGLVAGGVTYLWLGRRDLPLRLWLVATSSLVLGLLVALTTPLVLRPLARDLNFRGPVEGPVILLKTIQFLFSTEANSDRLLIWQTDLRVIHSYPWFGVGLGVFPFIVHQWAAVLPQGTPPHNLFLDLGAEVGIPGAAAFLAMPLIAASWRLRQRNCYRNGQIAAMAGMMVAEIRDNVLIGFHMSLGFVLILAMLLTPVEYEGASERER